MRSLCFFCLVVLVGLCPALLVLITVGFVILAGRSVVMVSSLQQQRPSDDTQATKCHGCVREGVEHTLRYNSGPVKANSLLQSVSNVQPRMAEWLLDPHEKAGISSGFLGARLHVRVLGIRRVATEDIGSFWMRVRRVGHQRMKQHDTSRVNTFHRKHMMAGHFARLDLSSWRQQQQHW